MKTQQIVKRLTQFKEKDDATGALDYINGLPSDALAVHAVIRSGWVDLVSQLDYMERGDTLSTPDESGALPLHLAAGKGAEMLRAVILQNVDNGLFDFDEEEHTPAMIAALDGNIDALRILARAGADFDQVSESLGHTALESACWSGKPEVVAFLLDAGADPTLPDLDMLSEDGSYESLVEMVEEAARLRESVDNQRFKTIQVSMSAGEADFVMPAKIAQSGDLFVADVIGDLHADTNHVRLERGERFFGDEPGAIAAAATLGLGDVAQRIARKRAIQEAQAAPAPKGSKPH